MRKIGIYTYFVLHLFCKTSVHYIVFLSSGISDRLDHDPLRLESLKGSAIGLLNLSSNVYIFPARQQSE